MPKLGERIGCRDVYTQRRLARSAQAFFTRSRGCLADLPVKVESSWGNWRDFAVDLDGSTASWMLSDPDELLTQDSEHIISRWNEKLFLNTPDGGLGEIEYLLNRFLIRVYDVEERAEVETGVGESSGADVTLEAPDGGDLLVARYSGTTGGWYAHRHTRGDATESPIDLRTDRHSLERLQKVAGGLSGLLDWIDSQTQLRLKAQS